MSAPAQQLSPSRPYPGIEPFQFTDQSVFFARASEVGSLMQYVNVYRAVLCYGDSGAGKSSIVNAGLIPEAIAQGFCPERFRVQPTLGEEFVVERVSASLAGQPPFLPSIFADDDTTSRFVLSAETFEQKVRGWKGTARPLLIFDQFEELVTQFEEAPVGEALKHAENAKGRILEVLAALITDPGLHVKLLFSFREDYLAKILRLFDFWPEIRDQYVRITPPSTTSLLEIIRGPFERNPGVFETEIQPDLAERIAIAMGERDERGMVNLSELQIALVRLWQSTDPRTLFEGRGIQGLLEDYTTETLESIPPDLRSSTVALLSNMITESGARNVISEEDLLSRVEEEEGIPRDLLKEALRFLEQDARLIRREHRHEVAFYEIVSEFLAPWITRQREQAETIRELERAQALAAEAAKRRLRRVGLAFLILIPLVVIPFALFAVAKGNEAARQANTAQFQRSKVIERNRRIERLAMIATSRGLAAQALLQIDEQPDLGLLLAVEAVNQASTADARGGLLSTLQRFPRLKLTLRPPLDTELKTIVGVAYSQDGQTVAAVDRGGALLLWDATTGQPLAVAPAGRFMRPTSMSITPDGDAVAVGTSEGDIFRWVLTHGELDRELFARVPRAVDGLAFGSNGTTLAALTRSSAIFRWDSSGEPLEGGPVARHDLARFSSDGGLLASWTHPGAVAVTNISTGEVRAFDVGDRAEVAALAIDDSNERLAFAGLDGRIFVLDLATGEQREAFDSGQGAGISALAFSRDGATLAVGYIDAGHKPTVSLFHGATNSPVGQPFDALAAWDGSGLERQDGIAISPDGLTLATPGAGGVVRLWNTADDLPTGTLVNRGGGAAAVSGDGRTLAVQRPGQITLSDVDTGETLDELDPRRALGLGRLGSRQEFRMSSDGTLLASDHSGVGTVLWRIDEERHISRDPIVLAPEYYFAAFGGPDIVALRSSEGIVLWDVGDGKPAGQPLLGPRDATRKLDVAFSPNGSVVAIASAHGVRVYRSSSGEMIGEFDYESGGASWNVASHEAFEGSFAVPDHAMVVSADGNTLFSDTYGQNDAVRVWDVEDGRRLGSFARTGPGSSDWTGVALSHDGLVAATGSTDVHFKLGDFGFEHLLTFWDVTTRQRIGTIPIQGFTLDDLFFDPTGRLYTVNQGRVIRWDVSVQTWIDRACQMVGRNLTQEEWDDFLPSDQDLEETCPVQLT
jgi:WD40 repeat protein